MEIRLCRQSQLPFHKLVVASDGRNRFRGAKADIAHGLQIEKGLEVHGREPIRVLALHRPQGLQLVWVPPLQTPFDK